MYKKLGDPDTAKHKLFEALCCAIVITYRLGRKHYFDKWSERKYGGSNTNHNKVKGFYPMPNAYLAKCLNLSISTAYRIKQKAEDAGYIKTKSNSIIYSIEGISTEGTEVNVRYINNKIESAKIIIYGDLGQIKIEYFFLKDRIRVDEKIYSYMKPISEIDLESDLLEEYELKYFIDYNGKRIKLNRTIAYTDIFSEFAKLSLLS